jgi:rare lipoprotein A
MVMRLGAAICGAAIIFASSNAVIAHCGITPVYAYVDGKSAPAATARQHAIDTAHRRSAIDANGHMADRKKGAFVVKFEPYDCSELRFQIAVYHSVLAPFAAARSQHVSWNRAPMGATVVGAASMYNPFEHDITAGGIETASGELYDPTAWTAAIHTGLRENFGGVRYGSEYGPTYALVETADKHVIVKINDVGPLRPGRVIDFSEQTMRFFDPTLQQGLVKRVKVTPLAGDHWIPGPVGG